MATKLRAGWAIFQKRNCVNLDLVKVWKENRSRLVVGACFSFFAFSSCVWGPQRQVVPQQLQRDNKYYFYPETFSTKRVVMKRRPAWWVCCPYSCPHWGCPARLSHHQTPEEGEITIWRLGWWRWRPVSPAGMPCLGCWESRSRKLRNSKPVHACG